MSKVTRNSSATPPDPSPGGLPEDRRLPLRWAIIGLVTVVVGVACFIAAGIFGAVVGATAVAGTLHAMLA